jgi:hypothetical protein
MRLSFSPHLSLSLSLSLNHSSPDEMLLGDLFSFCQKLLLLKDKHIFGMSVLLAIGVFF